MSANQVAPGLLNLESQLMSIMDVLVRAAVVEITQVFSESASSLRLHLTQSVKENETLRTKMKVMRSELFALRLQTRNNRATSRPFLSRGAALHKPRATSPGRTQELLPVCILQKEKSTVTPEITVAPSITLQSDVKPSTAVTQVECVHVDAPDVILIKDEEDITACGSDDGEADFENHNMHTDVGAGMQDIKPVSSVCVTDNDKDLKIKNLVNQEERPLREESVTLFSASELEALSLLSDHNVAPGVLQNFTTGANDRVQMSVNSSSQIVEEQMGHLSHIHQFTQQQNLLPSTTNKSLDCSFCGELFHSREEMIVHRAFHTGEPTTICTLCGKSFVNKTTLNIHMRIHTGEKPYACTQCGKRFTQNGSLKIHMRTHSGEKPYVCNECPASFNNPSNLRRHMSTHSIGGI